MTCLAVAGRATTSMPPTIARALGRDDPRGQHADGRRLAGAVRAEQPEDLAAVDAQVEVLDRPERAAAAVEDLGQTVGDDDVAVGAELRVRGLCVDRHRGLTSGGECTTGADRSVRRRRRRRAVQRPRRVTILPAHVRGDARRVQRRPRLDAMCRTRVRALRRPFVVRRARDRRRAADPLRPRHRAAPVRRTLRRRVPRHGAALAPALGSRAGPAVLHAAAPRGRDARRVRAAPGRARRSARCSPR